MIDGVAGERALELVERTLGFGVTLSALNALGARQALQAGGIMSWDLAKGYAGRRAVALKPFLAYPNVLGLLVLRLLAGSALLVQAEPRLVVLGVLWGTGVLWQLRLHVTTGADVFTRLLVTALVLFELSPGSSSLTETCLWFIALQTCLAYLGNGLAKLDSPPWRQGTATLEILANPLFGSPGFAFWLSRYPRFIYVLTRSALVFELSFPLVLLLGLGGCWAYLGAGVVFHALNARFLGLGMFIWPFLAAYPAVLHCSLRLETLLW